MSSCIHSYASQKTTESISQCARDAVFSHLLVTLLLLTQPLRHWWIIDKMPPALRIRQMHVDAVSFVDRYESIVSLLTTATPMIQKQVDERIERTAMTSSSPTLIPSIKTFFSTLISFIQTSRRSHQTDRSLEKPWVTVLHIILTMLTIPTLVSIIILITSEWDINITT